jgi:hypothetical protein
MSNEYIRIKPQNITGLRSKLRQHGGHFLISEPGPQSFRDRVIDASLGIYDKPILDSNEFFHVKRGSEKRGKEDWQTGWENDRSYLLRETPKPTGDGILDTCRSLFDALIVGEYSFKIGFQEAAGRNLFRKNSRLFYVPEGASYEPAFRKAVSYIIGRINATNIRDGVESKNLNRDHIDRIVEYAMEDLRTSNVFKQNVSAGLQADNIIDVERRLYERHGHCGCE